MKPNRDFDILIAEKVMGLKNVHWSNHDIEEEGSEHIGGLYRTALVYQPYHDCESLFREVPFYGTEIGAAWEVVEKLRSMDLTVDVSSYPESREWLSSHYDGAANEWVLKKVTLYYQCSICKYEPIVGAWIGVCDPCANSAPEAICTAALEIFKDK